MGLVEEIAASFEIENDDGRIKAADANFEIDREQNPLISNPILLNNNNSKHTNPNEWGIRVKGIHHLNKSFSK